MTVINSMLEKNVSVGHFLKKKLIFWQKLFEDESTQIDFDS